jgi:hypothetical protein
MMTALVIAAVTTSNPSFLFMLKIFHSLNSIFFFKKCNRGRFQPLPFSTGVSDPDRTVP